MQYRIFPPYFFLDLRSLAPHFPFTGLWEPGNFMGYVLLIGLLELKLHECLGVCSKVLGENLGV